MALFPKIQSTRLAALTGTGLRTGGDQGLIIGPLSITAMLCVRRVAEIKSVTSQPYQEHTGQKPQ